MGYGFEFDPKITPDPDSFIGGGSDVQKFPLSGFGNTRSNPGNLILPFINSAANCSGVRFNSLSLNLPHRTFSDLKFGFS
jgi:hypothetical protein